MRIETTILNNLLFNEEYSRKVIPFLNKKYFSSRGEAIVFEEITKFFEKYNKPITQEILAIEVGNRKDISDTDLKEQQKLIVDMKKQDTNEEWLLQETEQFCKKKAVYNAILDSIAIIDGRDKERQDDAIPSLLSDALGVSFDNHVGHSYLSDSDERYEFYHRVEEKIKFDLDMLNKITKGGLSNKTLNVILAGTGVGKSIFKCHSAAAN
jgi:replicative DNA helicase